MHFIIQELYGLVTITIVCKLSEHRLDNFILPIHIVHEIATLSYGIVLFELSSYQPEINDRCFAEYRDE